MASNRSWDDDNVDCVSLGLWPVRAICRDPLVSSRLIRPTRPRQITENSSMDGVHMAKDNLWYGIGRQIHFVQWRNSNVFWKGWFDSLFIAVFLQQYCFWKNLQLIQLYLPLWPVCCKSENYTKCGAFLNSFWAHNFSTKNLAFKIHPWDTEYDQVDCNIYIPCMSYFYQ